MNKTIKKNNKRRPRRRNAGYNLAGQGTYTSKEKFSTTFLDPHKYVTLHYSDPFLLSATTGIATQQTMNLNSLFDPDRTGTGHQPYGYDPLALIYNRYRVLRCHYRIIFGTSAGTVHNLVLPLNGLLPTTIVSAASFATACENPRARICVTGGSGAPSNIIEGTIALNALTGVTITEYKADDRFEAQIGASPSEVMTLVLGMYNPNGVTINQSCQVDLYYCVDLHDPISQSGS